MGLGNSCLSAKAIVAAFFLTQLLLGFLKFMFQMLAAL